MAGRGARPPVHELHARRGDLAFELLLNEVDDLWRFRRNLAVTHPRWLETTRDGWPVVAPEIVLLYKTKNPRSKDEADRAALWPALDRERRRWLETSHRRSGGDVRRI